MNISPDSIINSISIGIENSIDKFIIIPIHNFFSEMFKKGLILGMFGCKVVCLIGVFMIVIKLKKGTDLSKISFLVFLILCLVRMIS